jgi:hypothetical protein
LKTTPSNNNEEEKSQMTGNVLNRLLEKKKRNQIDVMPGDY